MLIPVKTELACLHIQALFKKNILKAIRGSWSSGLALGLAPHFTDAQNEAQGSQASGKLSGRNSTSLGNPQDLWVCNPPPKRIPCSLLEGAHGVRVGGFCFIPSPS